MATLTKEQMEELKAKSPEDLVRMLAAQHEITDRFQARAEGAEGKLTAAEKKAQEDEEARRLANASETEKEKAAREKAEKALADERSARRGERVAAAVRLAAIKAGAADPDDVLAILGTSGIEVDDAGNPKDVEAKVAGLLEKKPHLKGGKGNGWAGDDHQDTGTGHRGGKHGAKEVTRAAFDAMSPSARMEHVKKGGKVVD